MSSLTASGTAFTINPKKEALIKSSKLPGYPKGYLVSAKRKNFSVPSQGGTPLIAENGQVFLKIQQKDLKQLLGKANYPCYLDFSPLYFQLEDDDFLANCPNVVKELDLSSNALVEATNLSHLNKLKRLWIDNNLLCNVVFKGLNSLELLSLSQNRIEQLNDTSDLKKLINLDLSGNRINNPASIQQSMYEIGKIKSLRVLDLGTNNIDLPIHEFYNYALMHIRKLPKLESLNFTGNPVEDKIKEFKFFVINEMPKLKYFDWEIVSKEDLKKAHKLESDGLWDDHLLPLKASHTPKGPGNAAKEREIPSALEGALDSFSQFRKQPKSKLSSLEDESSNEPSDRDAKARMLEMLLQDESDDLESLKFTKPNTPSSPKGPRASTVIPPDDLFSKSDPLDDILNQLASTASDKSVDIRKAVPNLSTTTTTTNLSSSGKDQLLNKSDPSTKKQINYSPLPASNQPLPDIPEKPFDEDLMKNSGSGSNARDAQEIDYLQLVNEVLILREGHENITTNESNDNNGNGNNNIEVSDSNYLDMLHEIIGQSKDDDIDFIPPIPSGSPNSVPSPSPSSSSISVIPPQKKTTTEVTIPPMPSSSDSGDINSDGSSRNKLDEYLNVLDQMMSQRDSPDSKRLDSSVKQSTPAKSNVTVKSTPTKSPTSPTLTVKSVPASTPGVGVQLLENTIKKMESDKLDIPSIPSNNTNPSIPSIPSINTNNNRSSVVNPYTSKIDQLLDDFESFSKLPKQDQENDLFDFSWEFSYKKELSKELDTFILNKGTPIKNNRTLGIGYYGTSYKVVWREQEVVAKHLSIISFSSFQKEMKTLVELQHHDNIVKILGSSSEEERLFIISEYISGTNLKAFIENKTFEIDKLQTLSIAKQLSLAILYLHSNNIIHRSLHPKNIIIDSSSCVKVKDYGYAHVKDAIFRLSYSAISTDISFMSPEILLLTKQEKVQYDEKVDVYSFGMILWQLFTREEPFQGLLPSQIQSSVSTNHLRPSLVANTHKGISSPSSPIPFTFAKLMETCWAIEAEDRPPMTTVNKILSQPIDRLFTYSSSTGFGQSGLTFHSPSSKPTHPFSSPAPIKQKDPPPTTPTPSSSSSRISDVNTPSVRPQITPSFIPVTPSPVIPSSPVNNNKAPLSEEDVEKEQKIKAVVEKIKELIASPSDVAQIRAANAITSFAKIQTQVILIVESGLISDLCLLLLSKLIQVKEAAFNTLVSLCERDECTKAMVTMGKTERGGKTVTGISAVVGIIGLFESAKEDINIAIQESLLLSATKLLAKLAKYDETKKIVEDEIKKKEKSIIEYLIELLRSQNEFIQMQTTWTLSILLDNSVSTLHLNDLSPQDQQNAETGTRIQNEFLEKGGLSPLLKLLASPNEGLQVRAMTGLGFLLSNEKAQERIIKAGVLSRYVDQIKSNSPLLMSLALRSLASCAHIQRIKDELLNLNIPELLVLLLRNEKGNVNEQCIPYVLRCLTALTYSESYVDLFVKLQGVPSLLKYVSIRSHGNNQKFTELELETKIQAVALISNISTDSQTNREYLIGNGIIGYLVSLLLLAPRISSTLREELIINCLRALDPYVFGEEIQLGGLATSGLIEILIGLLSDSNFPVKRRAFKLISELAQNDSVKETIQNQKGIGIVTTMLRSVDLDIQESASFAIAYLSTKKEYRSEILENGGLQMLLEITQKHFQTEHQTKQQAISALANFALDEQTQSIILTKGLSSFKDLLDKERDPTLISISLKLLLILGQNQKNRVSLLNSGILSIINKLQQESQSKPIQLACSKIIQFLS